MIDGHEFLYEFGPYTLDGRERVLLRDGRPVSLAPKALETLLVLLRNSGHLVEKEQLMSEVWPATYVEEANLTQNISILRKVLSEGGNGSTYIETVPRRGYRFKVAVRRVLETTGADGSAEFPPNERYYRFLAILPFANAGPDQEMEYLSDGITESIINSLSQLPQLKVMSRNTVFRYKGREIDAQRIGRELGVDAVLVGKVQMSERRLLVSAELVDVDNGWQLWGHSFDRSSKSILEVQEEIARQISGALRLKLTGDDEQRLTKRYTESVDAYQAYLKGRFHWSNFTRSGLEQATKFFGRAINLDPNFALAYAGIVDCYLRLATNYIPPAEVQAPRMAEESAAAAGQDGGEQLEPVKTRYKWDWTGVERELKRATELKSSYPAAHQWHAAYVFSLKLFRESLGDEKAERLKIAERDAALTLEQSLVEQIRSAHPTRAEEIQVFCAIAREQMEAGNYEGGCRILRNWWTVGEWPLVENLNSYSAGDLLFTAGSLTGWVASSRQIPAGQKQAEGLLNGAIGIFEYLGAKTRSCESQIELGYCYYREGLFDLARQTIGSALNKLPPEEKDLRSVGLIRLAIVERHAGRLQEALIRLNAASGLAKLVGPWVTGRYHLEVATTLKNLAVVEKHEKFFPTALEYYQKALYEFQAIGNHRYAAVVGNNLGFLLLTLEKFTEAERHLRVAQSLFESFGDKVCSAQVDETLARLHLAEGQLSLADEAATRAVTSLEVGDGEVLLSEALVTHGIVLSRLGKHTQAKRILERGNQLAERCRDTEGAARALLFLVEEMFDQLNNEELKDLALRLQKLLISAPSEPTRQRLHNAIAATREAGY